MPRKATGNVFEGRGKWYVRVTAGHGKRVAFALPTCTDEESAQKRGALMAELAEKLRKANRDDLAADLLGNAAKAEGKVLLQVVRGVELLTTRGSEQVPTVPTIRQIGERWTSGALSSEFPDHVYRRKSFDGVVQRVEKYIYPLVGEIPIDAFTDEHALAVMRGVPSEKIATRNQVGQILQQLCNMAVFPLRLIKYSPLPHGFFPHIKGNKAKGWLFPDEEAMVLGCIDTPIHNRILYGFLHREGTRFSEAAALTWNDIDLKRGSVTLDENKTNDPRAWALSSGVREALIAWREYRNLHAIAPTNPLVFVDEEGGAFRTLEAARAFRKHVALAGVDRDVLFKQSGSRLRLRIHDTRTAFVTVSLANDKTEAWVQDRTGHRSSRMINLYRRAARTAGELGLGTFRKLDEAIPEFRGVGAEKAPEAATLQDSVGPTRGENVFDYGALGLFDGPSNLKRCQPLAGRVLTYKVPRHKVPSQGASHLPR